MRNIFKKVGNQVAQITKTDKPLNVLQAHKVIDDLKAENEKLKSSKPAAPAFTAAVSSVTPIQAYDPARLDAQLKHEKDKRDREDKAFADRKAKFEAEAKAEAARQEKERYEASIECRMQKASASIKSNAKAQADIRAIEATINPSYFVQKHKYWVRYVNGEALFATKENLMGYVLKQHGPRMVQGDRVKVSVDNQSAMLRSVDQPKVSLDQVSLLQSVPAQRIEAPDLSPAAFKAILEKQPSVEALQSVYYIEPWTGKRAQQGVISVMDITNAIPVWE